MKNQFDKKFADQYIKEQLTHEKDVAKNIFLENMNADQRMMYTFLNPKKEVSPILEFYSNCNVLEKIMLVLAQTIACVLPFTMLAAFGSERMAIISGILWIVCSLNLLILSYSRKIRRGERISISFLPKFKL